MGREEVAAGQLAAPGMQLFRSLWVPHAPEPSQKPPATGNLEAYCSSQRSKLSGAAGQSVSLASRKQSPQLMLSGMHHGSDATAAESCGGSEGATATAEKRKPLLKRDSSEDGQSPAAALALPAPLAPFEGPARAESRPREERPKAPMVGRVGTTSDVHVQSRRTESEKPSARETARGGRRLAPYSAP